MKRFYLLSILLSTIMLIGCSSTNLNEISYNQGINIIPTPNQMTFDESKRFKLSSSTLFYAEDEQAQLIADFFVSQINLASGYSIGVSDKEGNVKLSIDENLDIKPEGYMLTITPNKIEAVAKDKAGLFYAMQSFMQLLPAEITRKELVVNSEWSIPCGEIIDEPRFEYRGIMLDVCRHFMPVEFIKKQIDILSMFKINRLHWHLTEDQAWRIEIKKYPLLTQIGSTRIEGEGFEYSGFYTQAQVRDIVSYAAERNITIIPEFELPGHELAAIAAYPHLSCKGEATTPRNVWGVEDIVMCPAKPETFEFIENVIDEMTELFPGEYFHVGGDECPKTSWEGCPACQKFIRDNKLQAKDGHSAEERLQSYIIGRAEQMLMARGKKLIGWDEILEGGLSPNATVMSWQGESGGIAAAMQGHDVVMSPSDMGMYINFYQGDDHIEPVTIGGDAKLATAYAYDPMPQKLIENGKCNHILGVQANLWTEYTYDTKQMEYQLYPNACALAEVGWSKVENKEFEDFNRRVNNAYVRLDSDDINYHIPMPEQPNGSVNFIAFTDSATVEFDTTRPINMVYTTDGGEPTPNSIPYTEPLHFTENTTLKICSVLPSGKMSPVRTITIEKQSYMPSLNVVDAQNGLTMTTVYGMYLNMEALANSTEKPTAPKVITKLPEIVNSAPFGGSSRGLRHSANIAEGYLNIPEDGVYYFRTNNNEFWIDGKLFISNDNEVKRYSRNAKSIALAKGMHSIKVVWLGHIIGGWPTAWESGNIMIRKESEQRYSEVVPAQLFYTK